VSARAIGDRRIAKREDEEEDGMISCGQDKTATALIAERTPIGLYRDTLARVSAM